MENPVVYFRQGYLCLSLYLDKVGRGEGKGKYLSHTSPLFQFTPGYDYQKKRFFSTSGGSKPETNIRRIP